MIVKGIAIPRRVAIVMIATIAVRLGDLRIPVSDRKVYRPC